MAFDNAKGDGIFVGAFVAHHADAFDGEENGEALPDTMIPVGGLDFFDDDGIGFAEDAESEWGDFADDTNGEAWAWEGLAESDFFGEAELGTDCTDFIFEEFAERFDQLELHVFRESSDIVVGLDHGGGISSDGDALDDIWVERSLGEELEIGAFSSGEFLGSLFENANELCADDFAFTLWRSDSAQFGEEASGGVNRLEADLEIVAEETLDGGGFIGAEEAIIDEDTGELVANCAVEQSRSDATIDAAAKAEEHMGVADLIADLLADLLDERAHRPIFGGLADSEEEIREEIFSLGSVGDFGMKLEAVEFFLGVFDGGERGVFGSGDGAEAFGEFGQFVAVTIPDG